MKTTVDIPDPLFRQAKQFAARHGIPLRDVFELGLQRLLQGAPGKRFRLKTITTRGEGLASAEDWPGIRAIIYEERGG